MRNITTRLALFALLVPVAAAAGPKVNPSTQIDWTKVSGSGSPAGTCNSTFYGMPYTDTATGNFYVCAISGWVPVSGGGGGGGIGGSGTPNFYMLWTGTTTAGNGHLSDDGTKNTSTEPFVVNDGTGAAGAVAIKQGTAASNQTTSVTLTAPTSVTSYRVQLPGAQPSGSNTYLSCTSADPAVCTWAAGGGGGSGLPLDPTGTIRDWIGNSIILVSSTPEVISTAWTLTSATLTATLPNTGTGAITTPGHDVLVDANGPACAASQMAKLISANSTTIVLDVTGKGCSTSSGTVANFRNGDMAIPEYAQFNAVNFVGHGTTNNYAVGGSDCAWLDTNYTSYLHPKISADAATAAAASAPLYVYAYCNGTASDETHLKNVWAALHAEGSNVKVIWLGVESSTDDPYSAGNDIMGSIKALNDWMYGNKDSLTAPATGQYLDDYIDIDPQVTSTYCSFTGGTVHLSNECTKSVATTIAGNVYPFPNKTGVNGASTTGKNNWFSNGNYHLMADTQWYSMNYVGVSGTNYWAGFGLFRGSPARGLEGVAWDHQATLTPGAGHCLGLYPQFGNDGLTQPIDIFLQRAGNGRLQFGTTCGGVDGGADLTFLDFQATTAPTGSCTVLGRWEWAKDGTSAWCDGSVWHSGPSSFNATGMSGANYVADSGSANSVVATLSPAVTSLTAGLMVRVKIAADNTTTTPTLAVNGLTATTIVKGASTALAAGDLKAGQIAVFQYDGTNFQLLNPSSSGGGGCGTANIPCTNTSNSFTGEQDITTDLPTHTAMVIKGSTSALTPTYVQNAHPGGWNGSAWAATMTVTAGNALVAFVGLNTGGSPPGVSAVTDSLGNTFTRVQSSFATAAYVACNIAGGADTVAVATGSGQELIVVEVSGVAASCVDTSNTNFTSSTGVQTVSTSVTTTQSDILVGAMVTVRGWASGTVTQPSGWTNIFNNDLISSAAYNVQTSAGTYTQSWTSTSISSGSWQEGVVYTVALKANTSATQSVDLVKYKDPTGTQLSSIDANGKWRGASGSSEAVSFSATPTFSTAYRASVITMTGNITSFTLGAGIDGQEKTLCFVQDATGSRTVAAPSNVKGFFTVGSTASKISCQHFTYSTALSAWFADSAGATNM